MEILKKLLNYHLKLNSEPILIQDSLIYLDFKNKISIVN